MRNLLFKSLSVLLVMTLVSGRVYCQSKLDTQLPVRGFCIALPTPENLDEFVILLTPNLPPGR